MKHRIFVSALAVLVVLAATTTAEAGIFGRLSTVWHGCAPCEPVACQPCEPIACSPCEVVVCNPCEVVCDPCGHGGFRPFRPFGGLFTRLAAVKCAPVCDPCEPVACTPCEVVACDPCEPVCDPCAVSCGPRLPFGGFFLNLKAKFAVKHQCVTSCDPCEPVCDPCACCR